MEGRDSHKSRAALEKKSRRSISDSQPPNLASLSGYDPPPFGHQLVKCLSENMLNRAGLSDVMKKQASSGGSMSALPHEVMLEMILKLSSVDAPTNWEDLARQYDLSEQEIIELATTETERPASALIHRMVRAGVTVKVLVSFLKNIKREDVVEVLKKARVWSSEEDIPAELTKSLSMAV
jgi:hypothetical protein